MANTCLIEPKDMDGDASVEKIHDRISAVLCAGNMALFPVGFQP